MRISSSAKWLSLVATMSWCASASGAAPDAERLRTAAEEFDAGRRAFKNRDFEGAAVHFENADRDAPSPEALQSAIRARKDAAQPARAATLAALGLARYPKEAALTSYARQVLADAEKTLHKVSIACQPECSIIVDNKVMPFPESATPVVYLETGRHTIIADWPNNRNKAADVLATPGQASQLDFQAAPVVEQGGSPTPIVISDRPSSTETAVVNNSGRLPTYPFFIGVGVTAVLGGITAWSGIDTINNPGKDAVMRNCAPPNNNTSCPDYEAGLSHQRRTNVLIAATGVAGLTTAVLGIFFTDWSGHSGKLGTSTLDWRPMLGLTDGVSVGAVGSF